MTGSVWSTLELHGNYSVSELKCHCDVHLVFLEGGILGHLHKKPTVPWLMGHPSSSRNVGVVPIKPLSVLNIVPVEDVDCAIVETVLKNAQCAKPAQKSCTSISPADHTYASPSAIVVHDVRPDKVHNDHSYAELSDLPTEPLWQ